MWTWVLANIALFSPIQFHNWLWPMQFAYFLPYTFLALCLCALYARIPALPKFVLAAVFALARQLQFRAGQFDLACRPFGHLVCPGHPEKRRSQEFCHRMGRFLGRWP